MGQLVFQATLGGAVNLIGPNIASTVNFTLPSADGSSGQTWTTNGSGVLSFGTLGVAGGGTGTTTSTGTGSVVLSNSPTLVTPALGTPSSATLTNATGLPISTGVSGLGTGVATALAVNVGSAGAPVVNGGALGTPSSGTVTNLTGTASININGTVGATTPTTGAFTTTTVSTSETLSYGTVNGVTYLNGSKVLTSGSALTFDGTTLKATTLSNGIELKQSSAGSATYYVMDNTIETGGKRWRFGYSGAAGISTFSLYNATDGVTSWIADSAGNLGLGVTPSAWSSYKALQVGSLGGSLSSSSSSDFEITTNAYYSGGWLSQGAGVASSRYRLLSGTHAWFNAPSATAGTAITFTQAMTLDASGNLGLAETSPSAYGGFVTKYAGIGLHANSTSGASGLNLYEGGTGRFSLRTLNGSAGLSFYDSFNGAERARIDSSGNLLVGTTSTYTSSKMTVQSTANVGIASVQGTTGGYCFLSNALTNGGTFYHASFQENGTQRGSITSNGTITVYNTTSDYRLKTVVGSVTGHGERIDALEPIEYTWNSNGSRTRGFLAHKFQEVYADSVTGEKDAVDSDGNPVYQAMQASSPEVIADLVAEIQSLRQRLAAANL